MRGKGSPNPLANKDPHNGPYSLADLDRGLHSEGGPNQLGHRSDFVPISLRTNLMLKWPQHKRIQNKLNNGHKLERSVSARR
jgi:hypothetical protein